MTTATSVPTAERIVAIDLGKYKSVACDYHPGSGEVAFTTLDTGRAELHRLLARRRPGVVVIEACALSGWVHDRCAALLRGGPRCPSRRADRLSTPADRAGKLRSPSGSISASRTAGSRNGTVSEACRLSLDQIPNPSEGGGGEPWTTRTVADDSAAGPRKAVGRRLDWRTLQHE
jgi:hypothetical protein